MLQTRKALPALAGKLIYQIAASVTATLVASAIFASLPKSPGPTAPVAAELTSGGKFAARIPGADEIDSRAADATMPLPIMTMVAMRPFDIMADPRAADVVRASDLVARTVRPKPHAAARVEPSRPAELASIGVTPHAALASLADAPQEEGGVLPKITSSARSLWSMTTSAGGSLLSHLMP